MKQGPIFPWCWNYGAVAHIGMQTLNFVVIFAIICPQNVPTPHIFKGHFPIVSCNVHELKLS